MFQVRPVRRRRATVALGGLGLAFTLTLSACSSSSGMSSASPSSTPPMTSASLTRVVASPIGPVIVSRTGQTLYMFTGDQPGKSTCTGKCLASWPIFGATSAKYGAGPDVTATITLLHRSDGETQLAADGWPLYTYSGDTAAGELVGQGVKAYGGFWYALSPNGTPITATAPGSSTGSSSAPSQPGY